MEYNYGLLNLLDQNQRNYGIVWAKWPQINPSTTLRRLPIPRYEIAPDQKFRLRPSVKVLRGDFRGWLYRALGNLLDNQRLEDRGYHWEVPTMPILEPKQVEFERWTFEDAIQRRVIYMGYYPAEDILFYCLI